MTAATLQVHIQEQLLTKSQILNQLANDKQLKLAARQIAGGSLNKDLYQELFLFICELPEQKIIEIHGKGYLYFFCLKIMTNQFNSLNSKFQKTYKASTKISIAPLDDYEYDFPDLGNLTIKDQCERLLPDIQQYLDSGKLDWYDKLVFEMYLEQSATVRSIAAKIGIPASSIYDTIKKVKCLIKQHLTDNNLYDDNFGFDF